MQVDPFTRFEKDWALLTAGTEDHFNSMTIGWGALGTVWNRDVLTVYVRPDRYTWQFMKDSEYFTVSFFPERCREALLLMGRMSGRDGDKVAAAGLTPKFLPEGITFEGKPMEGTRPVFVYGAPGSDLEAYAEEVEGLYFIPIT